MAGRRQRGDQRQAGGRQIALLAEQRKCVFEAPVGHLEPRIDQDDISHNRLLRTGLVDRNATPKGAVCWQQLNTMAWLIVAPRC